MKHLPVFLYPGDCGNREKCVILGNLQIDMRTIILTIMIICAAMTSRAATVTEIREMIDDGQIARAVESAREALLTDAANEGSLNALLGEALYLGGDMDGATEALRKATAKGVADAYRWLGRMAYDRYDFATASTDYARYFDMKKKASKPTDALAAGERDRIALAKRYFERVENIQVIDSLIVPREEFFSHYRLPSASGRLLPPSDVPGVPDPDDVASVVYASERGDLRMWARLDSLGSRRIAQSVKLTDGSWHTPEFTDSVLDIGNADYPFMTSDGLTLYFASDGPESIGGLDIFMATRDPADDTYRIPQNIGMPYNSPWDDYMFALDEVNNVGWWATDRNRLGDSVTIYVFIPNEIRENYPEDTENLASLALLTSIEDTRREDEEYDELLDTIRAINPGAGDVTEDFRFPLPGGRMLTSWDELGSDRNRKMMETYLQTVDNMNETAGRLARLRSEYHASRSSITADEIEGLEKSMDAYYKTVRRQRSELAKTLSN